MGEQTSTPNSTDLRARGGGHVGDGRGGDDEDVTPHAIAMGRGCGGAPPMPVAMGHGGPWLQAVAAWASRALACFVAPGPSCLGSGVNPRTLPPHSSPFIPLGGLPAYPSPAWALPLERFFLPLPRGVLHATLLLGWVSSSDRGVVGATFFFVVFGVDYVHLVFFFLP